MVAKTSNREWKVCWRPAAEVVGDGIEVILTVGREISVLGQIPAPQAVGVLAGSTLPRAVRLAKVDPHTGRDAEFLVARHLLALVIREALS
jgi:hypothetical protein